MSDAKTVFRADFLPASTDVGLALLRVWLGASLLMLHGMGKWQRLMGEEIQFVSVFGLTPTVSLALAVIGEMVAPLLLIVGFASRWAALLAAITMATAFFVGHSLALSGDSSGELAFIYLAGFVTLVITGPGRFSVDGRR
jgi:putative oxidoreductase